LNEGLRSIRYWKEIPGVKRIIANDLSESAVQEIKRNINFNDIPETCIVPNMADAM
jgi:tRNA (guanine26-N2/guanine27-N2)-dimethyltransferase